MIREDPTEVMLDFMGRTEKTRTRVENNGWTLREGVHLIINPKFRCPYCSEIKDHPTKGWFPTQRIWMVDEKQKLLLGVWEMDGTEVPDDADIHSVQHPHAGKEGLLCSGNSSSVRQLLFNGIVKGLHFRSTELFLLNVGHLCPSVKRQGCAMCPRTFYYIHGKRFGQVAVCSDACEKEADGKICSMCSKDIRGVERPEFFKTTCEMCFAMYATDCWNKQCGNKRWGNDMRNIAYARYYCEVCVENPAVTYPCCDCCTQTPIKDISRNGKCLGCLLVTCKVCVRSRKAREMKDGVCILCRPPEHDCRCGNKVRRKGDTCAYCFNCWNCSAYVGRRYKDLPEECRKCRPDLWERIQTTEREDHYESCQGDMVQGGGWSGILRLAHLNEGP